MSAIELSDHTNSTEGAPAPFSAAALFILAILGGSVLGLVAPATGDALSAGIDATLLLMIGLLFFELRLGAVAKAAGKLRMIAIAWCANFLFVPVIGFALASLFLSAEPLLFAGLMIYFLAPCTDWFLGFTRMAQGDTELGAALIPINMVTQLLLFPLWLWLFTPATGLVNFEAMPGLLVQWFLLPFIIAQALRITLDLVVSPKGAERILAWIGQLIPLVLAALIAQIFASHVGLIASDLKLFGLVAAAVFLFFVATYALGRWLSWIARLSYPQHALLAMTTGARNAPLMLALTAVAIPDQPVILAVIVAGMLVEIPHLTALRQLLLHRRLAEAGLPRNA